ncbi:MAG: hypothetical protein J6C30_06115, partial [Lentisphaeria bacterium]|nr:hypothetical protein [Lentisphaeria bacterium]
TMADLSNAWCRNGVTLVRQVYDGMKIYPLLADDAGRFSVICDVQQLIAEIDDLAETYRTAKEIINAYPDSVAAEQLRSMLEIGEEEKILFPDETKQELTDWLKQVR